MGVPNSGVLHHTGFVVQDIEKAAKALSESLSIGPWNIWTIEPTEGTVHGKRASFSFRVALADVGGASYELLSPASGETVYTEHLAKHGEGFHHTCLLYPDLAALRTAKSELLSQGREMVQGASLGDAAEFFYFQIPEIGSLIELLYLGELPPPEKTIE
jgi:catechol 2,3-dioxygenase-like lactoylglutathione lyase family enzyme